MSNRCSHVSHIKKASTPFTVLFDHPLRPAQIPLRYTPSHQSLYTRFCIRHLSPNNVLHVLQRIVLNYCLLPLPRVSDILVGVRWVQDRMLTVIEPLLEGRPRLEGLFVELGSQLEVPCCGTHPFLVLSHKEEVVCVGVGLDLEVDPKNLGGG
jgi:hypothetical protein